MDTPEFPRQSDEEKKGMNRRDLLKTATAVAAGLMTVHAASEVKGAGCPGNPAKGSTSPCSWRCQITLEIRRCYEKSPGDALSLLQGVSGMRWRGLRRRGAWFRRSPVWLFFQE